MPVPVLQVDGWEVSAPRSLSRVALTCGSGYVSFLDTLSWSRRRTWVSHLFAGWWRSVNSRDYSTAGWPPTAASYRPPHLWSSRLLGFGADTFAWSAYGPRVGSRAWWGVLRPYWRAGAPSGLSGTSLLFSSLLVVGRPWVLRLRGLRHRGPRALGGVGTCTGAGWRQDPGAVWGHG